MKNQRILTAESFRTDPLTAARQLIGAQLLCGNCSGIVVETEAYAAVGDKAAHTFSRPSARKFVAENDAGCAYVYLNYGMYWLGNVLVKGGSGDGFVLLRALEPQKGIATMQRRRSRENPRDLCSGPGKLTIAMGIDGADHGASCVGSNSRLRFRAAPSPVEILTTTRIGITKSADLPWRFLKKGSLFVSAQKKARNPAGSRALQ